MWQVVMTLGHSAAAERCCFSSITLRGHKSSMYWGPDAKLGSCRGWRCDGMKDRNQSLRQQKPMMTGKSYLQILSNQFANFFLLKSLGGGEIVPRLATKLECLQAGLASVRFPGACPVTPAPPSSPPPPSVLIRKTTEAAWEVRGCLPAGRALEIDPPTSRVICSHCSITGKLGRNRNKLREEKSTEKPTTWKSDIGTSQREECFRLLKTGLLPGLSGSGKEKTEVLEASGIQVPSLPFARAVTSGMFEAQSLHVKNWHNFLVWTGSNRCETVFTELST